PRVARAIAGRASEAALGPGLRLDFTHPPELQMRPMAARGEVRVVVSFGLTSSPALSHAVSYAIEHASATEELRSGMWEATFRIGARRNRSAGVAISRAWCGRWVL